MMFMQSVKDVWLVNQKDELKSCVHHPLVAGMVFSGSKPFWDSPEKTTPVTYGGGDNRCGKKDMHMRKVIGFLAYINESNEHYGR